LQTNSYHTVLYIRLTVFINKIYSPVREAGELYEFFATLQVRTAAKCKFS